MQPGSSRCRIVVAHPERKAQRALHRLVAATRCEVEVVDSVDELIAGVDASTIAIVDMGLAAADERLRDRPARAWIAVPGEGLAPAETATIAKLLAHGWDHVISHPMPILGEELVATVQKLIRRDAFGLEKYMVWGAEVRSYELTDALERDAAVSRIAEDVVGTGLPDRVGSLVSVVADELLANAIYAAPIDDTGQRIHAHDRRDQSRPLTGRDAVSLRWATDARYLAIEVRDHWGSLDVAAITSCLARGGNQTTGEGMGLQLAYACSNQLVFGCAPQRLTEVIALLDIRYKPMELGRSASFHSFTGDPP